MITYKRFGKNMARRFKQNLTQNNPDTKTLFIWLEKGNNRFNLDTTKAPHGKISSRPFTNAKTIN